MKQKMCKKLAGMLFILLLPVCMYASPIKDISSYCINSHDLKSLPAWGSYSKRYAGISHIADVSSGVRFDFSVMPGYYRNKQMVPNVNYESSYFPWDADPDATRYTYRYELEWKDRVYVDVTYHVIDSARVLVDIKCVNASPSVQNIMLNNMAYIDFAEEYPEVKAVNAEKLHWTNATAYVSAEPARMFPQYNLVGDGWMRFESRSSNSIDGSLLAKNFGRDKGDKVVYNLLVPMGEEQGAIAFRYRVSKGKKARFIAEGLLNGQLEFEGTGNFELMKIPYRAVAGKNSLTLTSEGESEWELDGFYTGKSNDIAALALEARPRPFMPEMKSETEQDFMLKYTDCNNYYGVSWNFPHSEIREFLNDELDKFLRHNAHSHGGRKKAGNSGWHYANAYFRPVVLPPNSEQTLHILLCTGTKAEVAASVAAFHRSPETFVALTDRKRNSDFSILPGGEKYRFGYQLMQACYIGNFVYPIYTQGEYIRHFSPGKHWNSLYTWDLGFSALGLVEIDPVKSFECIRAYTTEPGAQSAFIHHGTPMPTQFFAFSELWNETQSKPMLQFLYPRLKQYAEFMIGKNPTSTTRMKSNLLKTWDYCYNSGGWDDYPPQQAVHRAFSAKRQCIAPMAPVSAYIRALKILRMTALELGLKKDVQQYDVEIKALGDAILKYAWDEEAKYFSYVEHDTDGNPTGFLRYQDGSNYNKGLDGIYPLIAGIVTPEQSEALIGHLFNPNEIWTPIGLSTVDRSAPYYRMDGYWNGAVWMPHQWSMWKAMLDLGEGDRARQIAMTALEVWEKECEESYYTFEHFIISSGRGAGWHQFTGISSPVLNWFSAYYKIGKVSTGFEIWLSDEQFNADYSSYQVNLRFDDTARPHERCMLVCLNPDNDYTVTFNGKPVAAKTIEKGLIQITLPASNKSGKLSVK